MEHERKTDGFDAKKLAECGQRFEDRLRLTEALKPHSSVRQLKKPTDRRASAIPK